MSEYDSSSSDNAIVMSIGAWSKGIQPELKFWKNWITSKGAQWSYEFNDRLKPDTNIDGKLGDVITSRSDINRILDVGAGPLTTVGKKINGKDIIVEATDPLANFYSAFLEQECISPPVKTQFSTAEDLSLFYKDSIFDLVHCRNALDHSFDPIRAIIEMLRVVKVGGLIVLDHHENEAEGENYSGFHQYNFTEEGGEFIIWNKSGRTSVNLELESKATVKVERVQENIFVVIEKIQEFKDVDLGSRHRARAAVLLKSLVEFYGSEAMKNI